MDRNLIQIIQNAPCDEALVLLEKYILEHSNDDEAYYLQGNIYKRLGKYGDALNSYTLSVEKGDNAKAKTAIEMLNKILAYRCNDLLNP